MPAEQDSFGQGLFLAWEAPLSRAGCDRSDAWLGGRARFSGNALGTALIPVLWHCLLSLPHPHPLAALEELEAPVTQNCPFSVMTPEKRGILFLLSRYTLRRREDDSEQKKTPKKPQRVFLPAGRLGMHNHQPPKYFMTFHRLHDRYEQVPMVMIVHGLQAEMSEVFG